MRDKQNFTQQRSHSVCPALTQIWTVALALLHPKQGSPSVAS